jgi:pimeloyl-ACP methyl ester carboxylesterase
MKKITWLLLLFTMCLTAQNNKIDTQEITIDAELKGTLYAPSIAQKKPILAILIAGSGPTNRSGNQPGVHNSSLKYLAEGLAANGIHVFGFDKRIIAQLIAGKVDESKLVFEDNSTDVNLIVAYFKNLKTYSKIVLIGHSEGSLVGMMSATKNVDGFVSIAGPGRPIDEILYEQIAKQSPKNAIETRANLDILKSGKTFDCTSESYTIKSIFRNSVQNYLISWIKINPQTEIQKLKIPILLINGTKDLQVPESEASLLQSFKPNAKLVLIENMNHVFKTIQGDESENRASYNEPKIGIAPELITSIFDFIKKL